MFNETPAGSPLERGRDERFSPLLFLFLCNVMYVRCFGHNLVDALSSQLSCVDQYIYFPYGRNVSIAVCEGISGSVSIIPSLPKGIEFRDGTVHGKTVALSPLMQYTIEADNNTAYFWLTGSCTCLL